MTVNDTIALDKVLRNVRPPKAQFAHDQPMVGSIGIGGGNLLNPIAGMIPESDATSFATWSDIERWSGYAGEAPGLASAGLLYLAKSDAQDILRSALSLQRERMVGVAVADTLDDAAGVFRNPNGRAALSLAEAAGRYGTALSGLSVAGNIATVAEQGAYVMSVPDSQKLLAAGAAVTNVAGDISSTYLGAQGGAAVGAWLAPWTFGLSIPVGAVAGGIIGHYTYSEVATERVREG